MNASYLSSSSLSKYKYNILTRLASLDGGMSLYLQRKRELIQYLEEQGAKPATVRKWLAIERGSKQEIPLSTLALICDFINEKYIQATNPLEEKGERTPETIRERDLYNAGQMLIIPHP